MGYFHSRLISLRTQELYIRGCSSLEFLPEGFGGLASLRVLNLKGCTKLTVLPKSLCELRMLEVLLLANCPALRALPSHLYLLSALEHLDLRYLTYYTLTSTAV